LFEGRVPEGFKGSQPAAVVEPSGERRVFRWEGELRAGEAVAGGAPEVLAAQEEA
jgi:hypothetical protein